MSAPRLAPPLAVVTAAARALASGGTPEERLAQFCSALALSLPAEAVVLRRGERRAEARADGIEPAAAASRAVVPWLGDRPAMLEAQGAHRAPAELRPILETAAALLAASLPMLGEPDPGDMVPADLGRRLHDLTIDALPVGLYVVDRDYRIVLWNRKRETGTQGLRREDVLGCTVFEVLHRQPPDLLRAEFDGVFTTGEVHESEQDVVAGDDRRTYRTTRLPMRVDGTTISHVITIGEDVTATRDLTRAMYQSEKLAAVGQLAAGVMHEVNNPLATIGACVAAISSRLGGAAEPVVREYLDIIESEVARCTGIVDGLLDFSRAGRVGGQFEPADLNALLDRTLYLLKHHQRFRRLEVTRDFDPRLPRVLGNGERLIQAAMAILLNAADATQGRGHITVTTRGEPGWVVLELADDGPGIPADVLPKIFEPFFTTKGPARGTGLGLAICYGIIADHHGRIDVQSEPGRTTFRIALPAVREEER
ncbi:MAG TPA: ATP-binding protein [Gemmatimonadales bacterium]|nr:ATP-binding protein [Gemmatimonadales bacterium]